MNRPGLLVGVWLLGVATATGVAWGAVRVVGEQVADRSVSPLTARVVDGLAAGTPTPTPVRSGGAEASAAALPSRSRSAGPSRTRATGRTASKPPGESPPPESSPPPASPRATARTATFSTIGGTVAATCSGSTAALRYASPAAGFASEVESAGPAEVQVGFRSSDHESKVRVECVSGAPDGRVEESDDGSGHG